ncbi:MAG TPA: N-acetylmuramoyl-L-alanine amidase [Candidatus Solibacter sp.]|nr:N-acetylmuramoyl-L-alanine amidase [Candidatus Solibacter sp.]
MATTTTNPGLSEEPPISGVGVPAWPRGQNGTTVAAQPDPVSDFLPSESSPQKPAQHDALHALLAFSALHEQLRRRKVLAARHAGLDAGAPGAEFESQEQLVLDDVLQLVAERAIAITGADGLAIALAENNEIVLRAAAGSVRPDIGARIDRDSAFSGACFRSAEIVICDDTETDARVNLQACRKLGARSMVAVPLCGRRRVIGLLEAFSSWPFGFNESDVRNLSLLAELVLGALKPEDEDRFAESAKAAAVKLEPAVRPAPAKPSNIPPVQVVVVESKPVIDERKVAGPETNKEEANKEETKKEAAKPEEGTKPETKKDLPAPTIAVPAAAASTFLASVTAKVASTEVAAATPAPVLHKPAVEEKAPTIESQVTAETASDTEAAIEPELTFGLAQSETENKLRPATLIALLAIVVIAAFAGGMWWKLKTSQIGSQMVKAQKVVQQPTPSKTAGSSEVANSAPATSIPDSMTDTEDESASPATPQELAKLPKVTGIRHWSSADSSTVVLDLEDQVQYEAHRLANPDRIYFDLHDTQLAPDLAGKSVEIGDPLLNRVRVAQPIAGMTRIVLETRSSSNFSVSLETNPYRLIVEVRKLGSLPKGAVNLFPGQESEKAKLAIVVPPPTKEDLQWRAHVSKMKIVVDAGHGGWDLGTVGKRGLLEKDLVLEISERLGKLLQTRLGADVIYTRPDDNYITLDDRATIANQSQADLFVSVHANYSDLPSARGVETYYTNFFSAPGSKNAVQKDVDAHAGVANAALPTLSAADLHDRIEQSRRLAASVQRSLYGTLSTQNPGLRDRGIKEASFVVLTESSMPGILAEVSFVSSPTDEQKLRSDGYREQIAEALYRGIARYAVNSKAVKVASAK